jgi:hypothetical protein
VPKLCPHARDTSQNMKGPPLPPFGRLHVSLLSRRDVLLMKVSGVRPRDIEDIRALMPTTDELAFVAAQITRIAPKEPEKTQDMRDFLDE